MNRDDIIRMAEEAGIVVTGEAVWKLCEIVAAAEREACAQLCESYENDLGYGQPQQCANAIRARDEK
jgi:hypothetical protein